MNFACPSLLQQVMNKKYIFKKFFIFHTHKKIMKRRNNNRKITVLGIFSEVSLLKKYLLGKLSFNQAIMYN